MENLQFTADGLLPPGDYHFTFDMLRTSILVLGGEPKSSTWDSQWRLHLVNQLELLTEQLWDVGVESVYADGSFAENKDHPNDIDGYFEVDCSFLASGELERKLNLLDSHKAWTRRPEDRMKCEGFQKLQLPMWHHYRVELYPHIKGFASGIRDQYGNDLEFPAAFRRSRRDGKARGIIALKRS